MPGKSMRELREWDGLKTFVDPRLAKALGHPVREHILAVLNERIASAREISKEVGADVSSFYHHVEELERLECIERVTSKRRRGASEHFFRATTCLFFDDAAWQKVPSTLKEDQTVSNLQRLFDDVVVALEKRTFDARENPHVSWMPGFVDAQAWDEATALMNQTLDGLMAIREAAALRLAEAGERGIPVTMGILAFETPATRGKDDGEEPSRQAA
jgi:DNA-binding transcriptional ArsR family regulator